MVVCMACGAEHGVDFAHCLSHGWPVHCRRTMTLVRTDADIAAAVGETLAPMYRAHPRLAERP